MTKETDKISVIVPVYNVKNYLEDCVQSITHQTYPDLEILLIDDGSDDGRFKQNRPHFYQLF